MVVRPSGFPRALGRCYRRLLSDDMKESVRPFAMRWASATYGMPHTCLLLPPPLRLGGKVREHAIVHASATYMRS
jgi:hypothetical protein